MQMTSKDQQFWDVIKGDLMQMFHDLHKGDIPLFSLNFGVITLLPKTQEASKIQQYRSIYLLNVSFKNIHESGDNPCQLSRRKYN